MNEFRMAVSAHILSEVRNAKLCHAPILLVSDDRNSAIFFHDANDLPDYLFINGVRATEI